MTKRSESKAAKIRKLATDRPHMSAAQIAAKLGYPPAYVSSQLWRMKKLAPAAQQVLEISEAHLDLPEMTEADVIAPPGTQAFLDRVFADRLDVLNQGALAVQVGGDHYKKLKIQPVEYIHANNLPFIEGCIIKYATRWRDKGGVKDLEKIKHFADLLIELETRRDV